MQDVNGASDKDDLPLDRAASALEGISTVLRVVTIAAAIVLLIATLGDLVMIVFAAVLVAVLLRGAAARVGHLAHIGVGWGLLVVMLLLIGTIGGLGWWFGPDLAHQANQLQNQVGEQLTSLRGQLEQTEWGQGLLQRLPFGLGTDAGDSNGEGGRIGSIIPRLTGVLAGALWSVLGVLGTLGVILVAALYMAGAPAQYVHGVAHLLPKSGRPTARRVMDRVGQNLWGWLVGQFIDMLVVGVLVGIGLWLLGMPLVFILAVVAAATNFVPYIGAIAGAIPAVLIALAMGWQQALYVALMYTLVQAFEGNVTAPLIQQRTIDLPPALTLVAQTAFGLVFGLFGIILATPFTAAVIAAVQQLTDEDPDY
ncbi:MAG: AI-2E family transporter [Alphaproteobacteria bacterium]|nr:AI-2E family transporter [Alphaproteobacteria bacterium]